MWPIIERMLLNYYVGQMWRFIRILKKPYAMENFLFFLCFLFFCSALANSEEVFTYVLDHKVEGALVDVHGLKHHIVSLTQHNIQVNKILDRYNLTPSETIKTKDVTKSYGSFTFSCKTNQAIFCFRVCLTPTKTKLHG